MSPAPRRVLRYAVPIDDQPHEIAVGRVLMAMPARDQPSPGATELEVWVEAEVASYGREPLHDPRALDTLTPLATSPVQVFGTGQLLPEISTWLASCIDGRLVWHLYGVAP